MKGWKTYFTAVAAIIAALAAFFNGAIDMPALVTAIFAAIQTMNIRHAITTTVSDATGKKL